MLTPFPSFNTKTRVVHSARVWFLVISFIPWLIHATPTKLGDLDDDGVFTANDLAKLVGHSAGTLPLPAILEPFADLTQDGFINDADQLALVSLILESSTPQNLPLASVREVSPATGEGDVAVTRETVVHFSMPLALNAALDTTQFYAQFGARKMLSRVEISSDRKKATLFYLEPLPSNARVQITLAPAALNDLVGRPVDLDGDGTAGGNYTTSFDTLSITPVAGTAISGRVFASEPGQGAGGATVDVPLAGVTVTVDGAEETLRTTTDAQGNFTLNPSPAGSFFVHVDGRTSPQSSYPNGSYYPSVGKRWEALAGRTDNLSGNSEDTSRGTIYLPKILANALEAVSQSQDTKVDFPPGVLADNPALAGTELDVPANSLFADDGTRGGKVGIAPVAPDRLPSPLPPGLNLPMVITIQTDGATNFDRPVPITFPNLPDPGTGEKLPPGAKSALWSFNHDLGEWEVVGPMTVTEDGNFVKTDVGVGVRQPGWHGPRPGCQGLGGVDLSDCRTGRNEETSLAKGLMNLIFLGDGLHSQKKIPWQRANIGVQKLGVIGAWGLAVNVLNCIEAIQKSSFSEGFSPCSQSIAQLVILSNPSGYLAVGAGLIGIELSVFDIIDSAQEVATSIQLDEIEYQNCIAMKFAEVNREAKRRALARERQKFLETMDRGIRELREQMPTYKRLKEVRDQLEPYREVIELNIQDGRAPLDGFPDPLVGELAEIMKEMGRAADQLRQKPYIPGLIDEMVTAGENFKKVADQEVVRPDPDPGMGQPHSRPTLKVFFLLQNADFTDRFSGNATGSFSRVLTPSTDHVLKGYDSKGKRIGTVFFQSPPAGGSSRLPIIEMFHDDGADTDNDGLSTDAEEIIGTLATNPDTDGDGISDGAEVQQGTNPLNGLIATTGIIASVPTAAPATDICALNNMAVTANGAAGISVFNVLSGLNPTRIADVDTPGMAVAVASNGGFVAVADYQSGLAIVDISNPAAVRLSAQVNLGAAVQSVTVNGGLAIAGTTTGQIVTVDLATATILGRVNLHGGAAIQDLAVWRETLYALQVGKLTALNPDTLVSTGSLSLSGVLNQRRWRLFAGEGTLYATHMKGMNLMDVAANPNAPSLVQFYETPQFGWKQFIATGSGPGIAVTSPNGSDDGPHDIDLYTLGANQRTPAFTTTFETPGLAAAVSIYNGLAYVADSAAGLQVISYKPYDNLGVVPTISLSSNFALNTTTQTGIAEEGKLMRLSASVTDDVQVRNVEFYVDGQLLITDGNYPFEHRFAIPAISAGSPNFKVKAKATDTGGNVAWSDEFTITLVPDATPPQVLSVSPGNNAITGALTSLYTSFNEPMNPDTLATGFKLTEAGPDKSLGTADDVLSTGEISYRENIRTAFMTFASPGLQPGSYRITLQAPAADGAGNAIATPFLSNFRVYNASLDTDGDGIPDEYEALLGLNPTKADTNNNGILDGNEDFDNDGLKNSAEFYLMTNPIIADTNGNGILDGNEDSDLDGLKDGQEAFYGTNALLVDSDGDGFDDATEIAEGSDPNVGGSQKPLTRVRSAMVSMLNAAPEPAPANLATTAASATITYLNAFAEPLPGNLANAAASKAVSYLNAATEPLPTSRDAQSGQVSYRNNP